MSSILTVEREGSFSYPIIFENDFSGIPSAVKKLREGKPRACIITDSNVGPLYEEALRMALSDCCELADTFVFKAGEEQKHLDTIRQIYLHLTEQGLDRKSLLIALGGGVAGDMTGFAAATYLRGIDFIQVPTTLLAQVDSSVGGKTGVDLGGYKNMVGAFYQPRLVYMNLSVLSTLPEEQFICGMGEVLKTGLIGDGSLFRETVSGLSGLRNKNPELLEKIVRRSCEIKAGIVQRDPHEKGERALLNLGHTIGHAVEKLMDFSLPHGQCVGLGLICAARISLERGLITGAEYSEIRAGLLSAGLPEHVEGLSGQDVLNATRKDKKMENGHVKFILMEGLGHTRIDASVTDEEILCALREILL